MKQSISRNILILSVGRDYIGMPQEQNGHPVQHVMCQTFISTLIDHVDKFRGENRHKLKCTCSNDLCTGILNFVAEFI